MLTLYFGKKEYSFPNAWEELTPAQYLALVPLLGKFWAGEISLRDIRVAWFMEIAGLGKLRLSKKNRLRAFDNIYTASRQFNFFYEIDYDGKIDALSAENRRLLRKTAPEDIISTDPEIRYADGIGYRYRPDNVWAKNLIPHITVQEQSVSGWQVSTDGGALTSSLTARSFLLASDIIRGFGRTSDKGQLALLASILYPSGLPVSAYRQVPETTLYGIFLNFQALVSFIFLRTPFSILWSSDGGEKKEDPLSAMTDRIYMLSKSGFGDYEQLERMPLVTYLNIMKAELVSAVKTLSASQMKMPDIALRTHLPLSLIQKILS